MTNTTKNSASGKTPSGFSDEERSAMKVRAQELRAEERANKNRTIGEKDVISAISKMPEPDRIMAKKFHDLVTSTAPKLWPKTWYGMPAYAKDGKVVCFFQAASKFHYRYATLGFQEDAHLDEGDMWPTSFALKKLTAAEETKIISLVKKAVR